MRAVHHLSATASLVISCAVVFGCGATKDNTGGSDPLKVDSSSTTTTDTDLADGDDDDGAAFDVNEDVNLGDSKLNADATCATAELAASRPPVDVIVLVDTSGSMSEEMQRVQNNINKMSDYLKASGVDYRVALIAEAPIFTFPGFPPTGMCVPPPLAKANCASNPPIYRQVNEGVGSTDGLRILLDTYDTAGKWNDMLRPEAFKAFIVVSDDNATSGFTATLPADIAKEFDTELLKRGSGTFGTVDKRQYIFYPIVGAKDADLTQKCSGDMVNNGQTYVDLAKLTGGRTYELCATSFEPAFKGVGLGLASKVACEIAVPAAKPGETLDPNKVNVSWTPTGGTATTVEQDPSKPCDAGANGWQYNADKTKIFFCGDICAKMKDDPTSKVLVQLGCATKVKPPM